MTDILNRILETKRAEVAARKATVPLSETFGYATTVRSLSQGRATFSMEPSHYEPVPAYVSEEILKGLQK